VLSETAIFLYKCSDVYDPQGESGLLWCDPAVGIAWPVDEPLLSPKDGRFPLLEDIPEQMLFRRGGD
jgi:dTDP-4-dehydrorhamnose 3,5-epimerase